MQEVMSSGGVQRSQIVQGLALPFYLTGGTALSRHYFAHRYSICNV